MVGCEETGWECKGARSTLIIGWPNAAVEHLLGSLQFGFLALIQLLFQQKMEAVRRKHSRKKLLAVVHGGQGIRG